tara:strand:- start:33 stop:254 length:222 start_codon:yes stop_codon:yes gene_type:complete
VSATAIGAFVDYWNGKGRQGDQERVYRLYVEGRMQLWSKRLKRKVVEATRGSPSADVVAELDANVIDDVDATE